MLTLITQSADEQNKYDRYWRYATIYLQSYNDVNRPHGLYQLVCWSEGWLDALLGSASYLLQQLTLQSHYRAKGTQFMVSLTGAVQQCITCYLSLQSLD